MIAPGIFYEILILFLYIRWICHKMSLKYANFSAKVEIFFAQTGSMIAAKGVIFNIILYYIILVFLTSFSKYVLNKVSKR
jgi:uncharacterized membrane protein (DUF106 family)